MFAVAKLLLETVNGTVRFIRTVSVCSSGHCMAVAFGQTISSFRSGVNTTTWTFRGKKKYVNRPHMAPHAKIAVRPPTNIQNPVRFGFNLSSSHGTRATRSCS